MMMKQATSADSSDAAPALTAEFERKLSLGNPLDSSMIQTEAENGSHQESKNELQQVQGIVGQPPRRIVAGERDGSPPGRVPKLSGNNSGISPVVIPPLGILDSDDSAERDSKEKSGSGFSISSYHGLPRVGRDDDVLHAERREEWSTDSGNHIEGPDKPDQLSRK